MVRTADPVGGPDDEPEGERAVLPGWVSALLTGLALGAAGWLLVAVPVVVIWLVDRTGDFGPVFPTATQIWLLAQGGGLRIGEVQWTLAPLGITTVLLLLVTGVTAVRARRTGPDGETALARLLRGPACVAGGYATVVLMTAVGFGSPLQAAKAVLGALALAGVGALWGSGRVADLLFVRRLPGWVHAVPAAAIAAVWTVLVGGAAAWSVSILLHRERITAIADGLGADGLNATQLILAQLAFWPNLLVWAASWVLGSGFVVGAGTVVSPAATDLGLLPSVPVLGALPAEGVGHWTLAWLVVGVVAGVLAGLVVLRQRPAAGLDETALASFAAGVMALVVLVVLALLSRGDLGVGRLTGLGPKVVELIVLGGALLILPAISVGVIGGIVRHWRGARPAKTPTGSGPQQSTGGGGAVDDEEPTIRVGDRVGP